MERVRLAKETLKKFKKLDSRKLNELITGDETCRAPETHKQQAMAPQGPG
jgi:hypothetical protein